MIDISLVLLPGLDGTGVLFRPFLRCLPDGVRPVVVAYPGDARLGYSELLPIVLGALPPGPFVLLGESFAGPLAIMVAAAQPPGLRAVILCATFARNPYPYVPAWLSPLVRPLPFRLYPAFSQVKAFLRGHSTPAHRALVGEALSRVRPEVLAYRIRCVLRVNVTEQLASCLLPILYLRGNRDWVVPFWALRAVLRVNPRVQVARISAPHMVLQTQPAAAAVRAFLEDAGGGRCGRGGGP